MGFVFKILTYTFAMQFMAFVIVRASELPTWPNHHYKLAVPEDGDDTPKGRSSVYILPNEHHFYHFNSVLHGQSGALISVGTFRAFHAASQGDFSHAIILDYSDAVVDFNVGFLKLILASRDRLEFLAWLLGDPGFRKIFADFEEDRMGVSQLNYEIEWALKTDSYRRAQITREYFPRAMSLPISNFSDTLSNMAYSFAAAVLKIYKDPFRRRQSFLGSDEAFEKLKNLAERRRIYVVHGSLSGRKTMPELARLLRQHEVPLSVLDVSNSFKYIAGVHEETQFLKNIKGFHYSPQAKVLFTDGNLSNIKSEGGDGWDYFALAAPQYIEGAELFSVEDSESLFVHPYGLFLEHKARSYQLNGPGTFLKNPCASLLAP